MHIRHPKGFTLVELVATLIIIALIAAVGGPRFFDINTFREGGFYDETITAMRYAQKLAVETHCEVRVNIAATGYTLFSAANAAACGSGTYNRKVVDPSGNAPSFERTAPNGVALSTNPVTPNIVFAPDGSAGIPATVVVKVGNRSLQVIPLTGFVQRCANPGCT
jgi:MSHA pilin protein MshC